MSGNMVLLWQLGYLIIAVQVFGVCKMYLRDNIIEGMVFWDANGSLCKKKRCDFGVECPSKKGEAE